MKKVTFSRFEIIHRYSWIGPVEGFQTKSEHLEALHEIKKRSTPTPNIYNPIQKINTPIYNYIIHPNK